MKILFITQDYAPKTGGIETYCAELSHTLQSKGYSVDVICPKHKNQKEYQSPLHIFRIPIHSSFLFLPLLFMIPFLLHRKKYTHIVYGQWQNGLWHFFYPFLAKKYCKVTLVHGRELFTSVMNPFTGFLLKKTFKTMNHSLPNSSAVLELLKEKTVSSIPVTVVHPGANINTFFPLESSELKNKYGIENKIIIGHITRLVKRKNSIQLIELLPELLKSNPNIHLVIGGTGPEKENLIQKADELNLHEHITFLGYIPFNEINAHFNLADVFVLPSTISDTDIEGFGIVYVEANCCGIPVIGYRCGGVIDAIEDRKSGLLCDMNVPNALFDAIISLVQDPEFRTTLGAYGRERALAQFSWDINAEKIITILKSL